MRACVNKRPPGFYKVPSQPVIILTADEEAQARRPLFGVTDLAREVQRKTDAVLIRHPHFARVDICAASGEVLRTVTR